LTVGSTATESDGSVTTGVSDSGWCSSAVLWKYHWNCLPKKKKWNVYRCNLLNMKLILLFI
jgi:hypothetical protein